MKYMKSRILEHILDDIRLFNKNLFNKFSLDDKCINCQKCLFQHHLNDYECLSFRYGRGPRQWKNYFCFKPTTNS